MHSKKLTLATLLGTLLFLTWYILRPVTPPGTPVAPPVAPLAQLSAPPAAEAPPAPPTDTAASEPAPPTPNDKALSPGASPFAPWEVKIDQALRSQADHSSIAKSLLQQVPLMPPEGQVAAAHHITNLIADKDYLEVLPYLQNPTLASGFQEIIVAESLNRPKAVKLPVLLATARLPKHPMKDTATSILGVLLDRQYGNDWPKWEQAVKEALQQP